MKIVTVIVALCCAVLGCINAPAESSTGQALTEAQTEARARIETTNYATCMEYGVCDPGAMSTEVPEDSFIVDCWSSQSGFACCIGYWCCSVYWSGDFTCYDGG